MINKHLPPRMKHKFILKNIQPQQSTIQLDNELQLMTNNLIKVQRQLTQEQNLKNHYNQHHQSTYNNLSQQQIITQPKQQYQNQYQYHTEPNNQKVNQNQIHTQQQQINSNIQLQTFLKLKYQQYLQHHKFSLNYQQKINQLLDSEQTVMSIGNTIALFQMVFYFKEILTHEVLKQIQFKSYYTFIQLISKQSTQQQNYQKKSNENYLLKTCLSELIAMCNISEQQIVQFFVQHMLQNYQDFELSFKVLINMGYLGISTLIKILNQDFQQVSDKILSYLSKTQFIIQKILVPHIANDLMNNSVSSKQKNTSLMILTKLGKNGYSIKLIQVLLTLFKSNTIDKQLLISAIKSIGKQQGQKILIDLLNQSNLNEEIAVFIIKCLSLTHITEQNLQIIINQYPTSNLFQMNKLYFYDSQIKHFSDDQKQHNFLFINPRILSSMLQKLQIHLEQKNYKQQIQLTQIQCKNLFILPKIIEKDNQQDLPNLSIINKLSTFIDKSYKKLKIKQAAILAFGNILLPENSYQIMQKLLYCLSNSDPSILSSVCLTLSKINFKPNQKLIKKLSDLLKNNYWKVRISACQAIGSLIRQPYESLIQILIKCLKDGSINRQLVCQTMIKIHPLCQQLLVQILKESKDCKIQQIILCSFNQSNILYSNNLGSILEVIFEFSRNKRKQIRYICLGVVNSLRKYADKNQIEVSYLKQKTILPFYYNFLDDSCLEIRNLALNLILDFGSYAELVLIEGMTKGKNNCKIQCAKGLGLRGVQNFRALLLGMRDINEKVRRQCSESILVNFQMDEIIEEYKQKSSQCISLIYNIKDLIEGSLQIKPEMRLFLKELIKKLSQSTIELSNNLEEQRQIERQIEDFRQSMKMKNGFGQRQIEIQNDENINPNITEGQGEERKERKGSKQQEQKTKQKDNKQKRRYYFRLNQPLI